MPLIKALSASSRTSPLLSGPTTITINAGSWGISRTLVLSFKCSWRTNSDKSRRLRNLFCVALTKSPSNSPRTAATRRVLARWRCFSSLTRRMVSLVLGYSPQMLNFLYVTNKKLIRQSSPTVPNPWTPTSKISSCMGNAPKLSKPRSGHFKR